MACFPPLSRSPGAPSSWGGAGREQLLEILVKQAQVKPVSEFRQVMGPWASWDREWGLQGVQTLGRQWQRFWGVTEKARAQQLLLGEMSILGNDHQDLKTFRGRQ